ncbi:hypothetical protein lerEdw1_011964 [Lerista edwardsae]|nr:hypothetical protein lerEdw1_011964 [Lerista edwardsae]
MVLCAVLEPSQGQDCSTEKMENITVDIRAALSKGIRGTDPIHTASWEACVNVCCSGKEVADAGVLQPAPTSNKPSHAVVNEKSVPPQVHTPTKPPSWLGSLPKPIGSKMKESSSPAKKPSSKTDSQNVKGEGANQSKSSDPSRMHGVSSLLLPSVSSTIKHVVPTRQPTVKLPPGTTQGGAVAAMTPSASLSDTVTTKSTAAYHGNTLVATNPRKRPTTPQPATTSGTSSNNLHLLPSSSPTIFISVSLPDLSVTEMEPDLAGSVSVEASGQKRSSHFGGKNILLATLLLGVIFLLLVTVQIGRKMLESLRQKRYTRLDYLINGMYANM